MATTSTPPNADRKRHHELAYGLPPAPPKPGQEDLRADYVMERMAAQSDHRIQYFQQWTQNALFLLGKQHNVWDKGLRQYRPETNLPAWKQQLTTNIVYAITRTIMAKLTKNQPKWDVVPPSGDFSDRNAARMAQSLLDYQYRECRIAEKRFEGIIWYLCAGESWARVYWNPEGGEGQPIQQLVEVKNPDYVPNDPDSEETIDVLAPCDENGDVILGEDGQPNLNAEPFTTMEGQADMLYESPLAVMLNPDATSVWEATEMYVAKLWPIAKAAAHFNVSEEELKDEANDDRAFYENLFAQAAAGSGFQSVNSVTTGMGVSKQGALGEQVLIVEYSHKKTSQYKQGRYFITCGRRKVWPPKDDPEYPTGEAPLMYGFWPPLVPTMAPMPIPQQPHSIPTITNLVPLNQSLNQLDSHIKENEVTMSKGGKWVKHPADAGMAPITSDPAQVLLSKGYALGKPPMQVPLQGLPAEVYNERDVLMEKIRLIAALSEAEVGNLPEGVTSGRAFLVLQEVTNSVYQPDIFVHERSFEEIGKRLLVLDKRFMPPEKEIAIQGDTGEWMYQVFRKAEFATVRDVRVQAGSMAPTNTSAQLDLKLSILEGNPGLYTDAATGKVDRAGFAKFLDAGNTGLAIFGTEQDPDSVEINREHLQFMQYDPMRENAQPLPEVAFWQNHEKHYEEHCDFMKRNRGEYERWPDEVKQAFEEHILLTLATIQEQAATLVGAAGASGGSGMPPGADPGAGDPNAPPGEAGVDTGAMPETDQALTDADMASAGV